MKEFLDFKLIALESFTLRAGAVLAVLAFIVIVFLVLRLIKASIDRTNRFDPSKKYTIFQLLKYVVYLISLVVILQILGFNLTVILASSAALLVGVGLGLQDLFSDFVSGIIILIDGSVVVGDIVEINGTLCKVMRIDLRTTTVLDRNDNSLILPNSQLTKSLIINWTHESTASRSQINVGVDYASDVPLVMELIKQAALMHDKVLKDPIPFARFVDYGASSLDFSVFFWSYEVFGLENVKSEIRVNIYNAFKEKGIEIPFPQRVVHLRQSNVEPKQIQG